MPRTSRNFVPNSFYHIFSRGNDKNNIFYDDEDYEYFLKKLKKYKEKYKILIFNFVLMPNHYHFLIFASDKTELSEFIKSLNLSYSYYFRKKYAKVGYLYQGRYKSIIIENGKYLLECARYIENNPVKAKLVESVTDYKWSSIQFYISNKYSDFLTPNIEFLALSENEKLRKKIYLDFFENFNERRSEERLLKEGIYGSEKFKCSLKQKKIKSVWSHQGRPKKFSAKGEKSEKK